MAFLRRKNNDQVSGSIPQPVSKLGPVVQVDHSMKPDTEPASPASIQQGTPNYSVWLQEELSKPFGTSVVDVTNFLILEAFSMRASDIHIDPRSSCLLVRFRIDGVMQEMHQLPKTMESEVISRIKILASLRTDEHQTAQDGRFRLVEHGEIIDVRVSIVPTYHGENAVLRLLAQTTSALTLDALGFSKANQEKIMSAVRRPHGMILATGPTGSGKTTTLYSLINALNSPDVSIITIEDPIEYSVDGVEQIQTNSRTGLTFAAGLRSILRQDPNIIMVGEVRDSETAGIAVNAALTGHLLLTTLHTNDAPTTLPRLLDMKIEPYLIASTVNIAIGQRLLRKICSSCSQEKKMTTEELARIATLLGQPVKQKIFYRGAGCDSCRMSGYQGRIGIHEVLVPNEELRQAVLSKASASTIRSIAKASGMVSMVEDAFEKAAQGLTTVEEVFRIFYE